MPEFSIKQLLAIEELRQLQLIIGRQDELKARTKSIAVAMFSALTVGFVSKHPLGIGSWEYLALSILIALLFLGVESVYGATEIEAENRVSKIESFLRGDEMEYDGPMISASLVVEYTFDQFKVAAARQRTYYLYVTLLIIAAIAAVWV